MALVTCHDGIFYDDIEAHWDICINKFFEREDFIRQMLDKGSSYDEIVNEGIYFKKKDKVAEPMKSLLAVQDEIMMKHHISVLEQGGLDKFFPEYNRKSTIKI